jgi:hypothetical protein
MSGSVGADYEVFMPDRRVGRPSHRDGAAAAIDSPGACPRLGWGAAVAKTPFGKSPIPPCSSGRRQVTGRFASQPTSNGRDAGAVDPHMAGAYTAGGRWGMTEQEWATSEDPAKMLSWAARTVSVTYRERLLARCETGRPWREGATTERSGSLLRLRRLL